MVQDAKRDEQDSRNLWDRVVDVGGRALSNVDIMPGIGPGTFEVGDFGDGGPLSGVGDFARDFAGGVVGALTPGSGNLMHPENVVGSTRGADAAAAAGAGPTEPPQFRGDVRDPFGELSSIQRDAASRAQSLGDPWAEIEGLRQGLADSAGALEDNYQRRLEELRGLYRLAETPEERAQLQFALGQIERQREAGHEVIRSSYQQAIEDAGQRASQMRETAAVEGQRMGDLFRDAASETAAGIGEVAARFGDTGLGVGATPVSGDATDFVSQLQAAAPRQEALTRQLGNIGADDVAFLGRGLSGEQGAQQGELERLALQLAAQTQAGHQQRVQDRIARERLALADQVAGLGARYDDRRWGVQDRTAQMGLEAALAKARRQAELADASTQMGIDVAEARRQEADKLFDRPESRLLAILAWMNENPVGANVVADQFSDELGGLDLELPQPGQR